MCDKMTDEELAVLNLPKVEPSHLHALWETVLRTLPIHTESRLRPGSVFLFPLWEWLPAGSARAFVTDAGERLIGQVLRAAQMRALPPAPNLDKDVRLTV